MGSKPELKVLDQEIGKEGIELINILTELTGLPEDLARGQIADILESSGHSPSKLTLDELRTAMASYLESLHQDITRRNLGSE